MFSQTNKPNSKYFLPCKGNNSFRGLYFDIMEMLSISPFITSVFGCNREETWRESPSFMDSLALIANSFLN